MCEEISRGKLDAIYNAMVTGMSREDAFLYAGLTDDEVDFLLSSPRYSRLFSRYEKELEFFLLGNVKQMCSESLQANTWMLEHLYPRYGKAGVSTAQEVRLVVSDVDPASRGIVEVHGAAEK